jgi:hypothetical protein
MYPVPSPMDGDGLKALGSRRIAADRAHHIRLRLNNRLIWGKEQETCRPLRAILESCGKESQ